MKAFQGLLPSDTKTCLDECSSLVGIKKAVHELLWKYLRGHLKRDQTLQVNLRYTTKIYNANQFTQMNSSVRPLES